MKKFIIPLTITLVIVFSCTTPKRESATRIKRLLTDHMVNPMGLDNPEPRFSWITQSEKRSKYQTAFQILVASGEKNIGNNDGDIWDTGKINSSQSVHVPHKGKALESGKRYFWKVRIWDEEDVPSDFSPVAWFEMGKLRENDWEASWISQVPDRPGMPELKPAPYFRKEFNVDKEIDGARLYISGLGYYKAFLNGEKVGNHELDPVFTRYDRRVKYVKYDVTDQVHPGGNCIGVVLGNGWYNQHTRSAWDLDSAAWREDPVLMAHLEVSYTDGSSDLIITDDSWKVGNGPIVFDGIRNGEHYDARKEIPGWNKVGFNDNQWDHAKIVRGPEGKLSSQVMPPIRIIRELKPVNITEPAKGIYVIHFDENTVGRLRFALEGDNGQEIIMRYGERLKPDGRLNQKELARFIWTGETQTDRYTFKGEGKETWQSSFIYHGFQYVEISGLKEKPSEDDLKAVVLHTDLRSAGSFSCSNEMFNQLQGCILNSFTGNYHGYPTDCPHREKIGWSGDAQLVSATGMFNYHMVPSYLKWIDDFEDEQRPDGKVPAIIPTSGWGYTHGRGPEREHGYGPHWDGAYINIPWDMFMFTGDTSIIERYYEGFRKYMTYLEKSAENYILNYGINDHKQLETKTEGEYLSTAYFYDFSGKMSRLAEILNRPEDKKYYKQLADHIYKAFNKRFYSSDSAVYDNGGQTTMSGALLLGLVPEKDRKKVIDNLRNEIADKNYHIDAGVVGTRWMLLAATELSMTDVMFRIANQRDFPGWGYWMEQGATTMWQTWQGDMSLNHIMFGSIGEWFYGIGAGIRYDPEQPGFKHFLLKPELTDSLDWVDCSYKSVYGTIVSNWNRNNSEFSWEIQVPFNTSSTVYLPVKYGNKIFESDKELKETNGIKIQEKNTDYWVLELSSGQYSFIVK